MLELRPSCENCDKPLPNTSSEAMICTYECTYCKHCVEHVLVNVCPNCGGGFEKRPTRPRSQVEKHPASKKRTYKPVTSEGFDELRKKYQHIDPRNR